MNATVLEFLQKHQIPTPENASGVSFSIKSAHQINHVINDHKLSLAEDIRTKVSIANIVGYDYKYRELAPYNFLENLSFFYDANGTGYQTRSTSTLNYSTEEVIKNLAIKQKVAIATFYSINPSSFNFFILASCKVLSASKSTNLLFHLLTRLSTKLEENIIGFPY